MKLPPMTLKQRLSFHVNRLINDGGEVVTEIPPKVKAWRQPTKAEVSFGCGAIHWGEFERSDWLKPDGSFYKWRKFDGLRYTR